MSGNRNQDSTILVDEIETKRPKGITFCYSENFNSVIELTSENYTFWRTNILHLLMINNLEEYVTNERVKKLRKRAVKDDLDDYLEDRFDSNSVYDKDTSLLDIKNDVLVKWIIINSLGERTRKIAEGHGKTAFQTWSILEKSFTVGPEKRKLDIMNKINNLRFNEDEDINIFYAKLQNSLDELENIDNEISNPAKTGILNRSLPDNLRFINVFQYKNDWNKLCSYVKDVIPDILFSNIKETIKLNDNNKQLFLTETKAIENNKHFKTFKSKSRKKKKKMENALNVDLLDISLVNVGIQNSLISEDVFI